MAIGKNPKKYNNKKGGKKKIVDPFTKKDWYEIKAPSVFKNRMVGYSLCNRTQGTRIAADSLRGRIFETCLADLQNNEDQAFRKIKLRCEDVQGKNLLTSFYGMALTTDKLCSVVRKWQSLIEANVDVKTSDGYTLRLFAIGFTKRRPNQVRTTSYAQSSQVRKIRRKMINVMKREAAGCELKDLVVKFIPEAIGKQIEKECQSVYPLKDVFIRKVKTLRYPKFDAYKLAESHKDSGEDSGAVMQQAADGAAASADPLGVDEVPEAPVGDQ
eukprot:Plantae.Rhodophyta-Palmaria_palmata.ctg17934.p1 GENE.Plantae.Rhodophyta-Palmaria_palmata.ctg17934~~Plantae.Rhodophyta-Palmaria_palmata.ctg17934.p1  ORF type:complete len:271 (+),score=58.77 Plantae.Rhodophyta-Palmaria_palmata.ctg17934:51-863(+)